ncbi:MAG: nucleotidyltransferase domain-containing protein [Thermoleophilia bacterium]
MLACARFPLDSGRSDNVRDHLQASGLDWDFILRYAGRHGLAPMLFKAITATEAEEQVPVPALETLRKTYLGSLLNNQSQLRGIVPVLQSFAEHSIPVLLLKGPALCLSVYDDVALRPFGDIDILVHREHVPLGQSLLEAQGFRLIPDNYFPIPDDRNGELGCEWTYHKDGFVVELHWNLIDSLAPFALDIRRFWDGAQTVEIEDAPAMIMSPENQLLHLCLHQFKHHWEHLRDLTDIALVIERYRDRIDRARFAQMAWNQDLGACVFYNLQLADRVLQTRTDHLTASNLLGQAQPGLMARAMEDLIADHILETHLPRRFWELLMVDGARNRAWLIKSTLSHPFPRTSGRIEAVPRKKTPITSKAIAAVRSLYFYRTLIIEYLRRLARRLKHRS